MHKIKGFLALLTAGLLFGSMGVMIRTLSIQLSVYQQIFLRNIVALVLVICVTAVTRARWTLRTNGVPVSLSLL